MNKTNNSITKKGRCGASVFPAKAGIQYVHSGVVYKPWIPACAGMTQAFAVMTQAFAGMTQAFFRYLLFAGLFDAIAWAGNLI